MVWLAYSVAILRDKQGFDIFITQCITKPVTGYIQYKWLVPLKNLFQLWFAIAGAFSILTEEFLTDLY